MPGKARYVVKFVGYSAYVFARKYGREIDYAQLDFEGGGVTIRADRGWATAGTCGQRCLGIGLSGHPRSGAPAQRY